jgi:hypothetical protein
MVYYHIHNSLPLVPILNWMNPVHALQSYFFQIYFINITYPITQAYFFLPVSMIQLFLPKLYIYFSCLPFVLRVVIISSSFM